jgi:uncharacterized phage protein (TIGR01671 family)
MTNNRFKFRVFSIKEKKMYYFELFQNDENYLLNGIGYEVEKDDIIMQCTGVKDKNGKLIYEGDILEHNTLIGEVFFDCGCFCIRYYDSRYTDTLLCNENSMNKIIDNIYEDLEEVENE